MLVADAGQRRSLGAEAGSGDQPMNFSVVGTAPGVANDQANIFFRDPPAVISAAYALATVTPSVSTFTAAEVASFIAETGPYQALSWNFTGADAANTLASMKVIPRRVTPFGEDAKQDWNANTYQDAYQYQDKRLNVPLAVKLDGYTGVMITNTSNATPASYSLAVLMAGRLDKRFEIADRSPLVMEGT